MVLVREAWFCVMYIGTENKMRKESRLESWGSGIKERSEKISAGAGFGVWEWLMKAR